MYVPPRNDPDYSHHRLREILARKRLRFNPYTVSDKRLMDIVNVARWGDEYDITQAVVLEFTPVSYTRLQAHETPEHRV